MYGGEERVSCCSRRRTNRLLLLRLTLRLGFVRLARLGGLLPLALVAAALGLLLLALVLLLLVVLARLGLLVRRGAVRARARFGRVVGSAARNLEGRGSGRVVRVPLVNNRETATEAAESAM